ncbi:phage holin family protein [Planctellipticum variicoloris]|jgi:hypothetical protein|uniref:phage holin family protein n=1 Tax=Planctellipticum variicoloris TaxID=3064265 RepID=UPI0030134A04|nr:phage holin family protein [Planctomycetaceae bacterium SH412]
MADDVPATTVEGPVTGEADMASLVAGIIDDFRALVVQQVRLIRQEIAANLRLRQAATAVVAIGVALGLLAAGLLCLSLVHGLHWLTCPAGTDPAWLPLGACYAIVGAVLSVLSAALVCFGRLRLRSFPSWNHVADELIQETALWTTTSQPSAAR